MIIEPIIDTIKPNNNAHSQLSTVKAWLGIISDVHLMINTFITNKNSPNVMMLMGMVKITKMGLMNVFNKPNIAATNMAVSTPLI